MEGGVEGGTTDGTKTGRAGYRGYRLLGIS